MPSRCCVPNCKGNYDTGEKVSVFSFPKDEFLKREWINAIPRKDFVPSSASKVCERHFKSSDVERTAEAFDFKTERKIVAPLKHPRLRKDAVPSVFPACPSSGTQRRINSLEDHFEASQFERLRADGKWEIKGIAIPTISPKPRTPTKRKTLPEKEIIQTKSSVPLNYSPELYVVNISHSVKEECSSSEDSLQGLEETEIVIPDVEMQKQTAVNSDRLRSHDSVLLPASSDCDGGPHRKRKRPSPEFLIVGMSQITAQDIPPIVLPRKPQVKLPPLQNYAQPNFSDGKREQQQTCDEGNGSQEHLQRTVQTQTPLKREKPIVQDYNERECLMTREDYERRIKQLETENKSLKNQVEYLRNEATTFEAELLRFFNRDQLRWIQKPSLRKSMEWSGATLLKSCQLRHMIGAKGYDFIRHLGFPFPSDKTVIRKIEKDGFDKELFLLCKKKGK